MKDDRINLRIAKSKKEKLEKLSEKSKRKLNDYLDLLFDHAIKNNLKF